MHMKQHQKMDVKEDNGFNLKHIFGIYYMKKWFYRELIIKVDNEDIKDNIIKELNNKVEEYVKLTHGKKYKMYIYSIICGTKQKNHKKIIFGKINLDLFVLL